MSGAGVKFGVLHIDNLICLARYEKMISGKYVGELVRLALRPLIKEKVLFSGSTSDKFEKFMQFETKFVSMIEAG